MVLYTFYFPNSSHDTTVAASNTVQQVSCVIRLSAPETFYQDDDDKMRHYRYPIKTENDNAAGKVFHASSVDLARQIID